MYRRQFLLTLPALAAGVTLAARSAPPPAAPSPEVKAVADANTAFALDLYAQLRGQPGNLFYSPFSVSAALPRPAAGPRGETRAELAKALHLPETGDADAAFGQLLKQLQGGPGKPYQLAIANALWGQQGFPFRDEYLALTRKDYGAGLRTVDFHNPEQARQTINRWVEEQTREKIKDLLPPGSVTPLSRLGLTNAIY